MRGRASGLCITQTRGWVSINQPEPQTLLLVESGASASISTGRGRPGSKGQSQHPRPRAAAAPCRELGGCGDMQGLCRDKASAKGARGELHGWVLPWKGLMGPQLDYPWLAAPGLRGCRCAGTAVHSHVVSVPGALCSPDPTLTSTVFVDRAMFSALSGSKLGSSWCGRQERAVLGCGQENLCCGNGHILLLPCAAVSCGGAGSAEPALGRLRQMGPDSTFWRVSRALTSCFTASRRWGSNSLLALSFSSQSCVKTLLACSAGY